MAAKKPSKITCRRCSKEKVATRDFYSTKSEMYNSIGRIDICKDCILEMYNKLLTLYDGKSNESFRHLCLLLDVYYSEEIYQQCVGEDNFIGEYMRNINSKKETKEKTSFNNKLDNKDGGEVSLGDGNIIREDLIVEWGRGREKDDYLILEKRYKELSSRFPSKTPEEQYIIKDICKLELDIEDCRRVGKTEKIASLENIKSKKMKDLDIIPSDKKNSMSEKDIKTFSMRLKIYETDRPVPDPLEEFKDCNNLTGYWERNIVKPMAKMQGLATGEYSLENGMEDIEFTPEYEEAMSELKDE